MEMALLAHCLLVDFDADVEVQGDVDIVVDVAGGVHIDVYIR